MGKESRSGAIGGSIISEPQLVIGIDPGANGRLVALSLSSTAARYFPMRSYLVGETQIPRLPDALLCLQSATVFIEHVQGRAGWGASQTFALGGAFFAAAALCCAQGWDVRLVRPRAWKRALDVPHGKHGSDNPKHDTLARYSELFPHEPLPLGPKSKRPDHNLVDALMIATYGVQSLGYPIRQWKFPRAAKGARKAKSYE